MKIYSDGWTNGRNPSLDGGGYAVMNEKGQLLAQVGVPCTGRPTTNNETELMGVLKATEIAEEFDTIVTDSMNTYWWVMKCKVKARPDLKQYAIQAKSNILQKHLELVQEPRENNLAGQYIEFTLHK